MRRVLSVCALLIAACSTPTGADGDLLTVLGVPNAVVLSNKTSDPVSYIIGTPSFFALYDPGQCDQTAAIAKSPQIPGLRSPTKTYRDTRPASERQS